MTENLKQEEGGGLSSMRPSEKIEAAVQETLKMGSPDFELDELLAFGLIADELERIADSLAKIAVDHEGETQRIAQAVEEIAGTS